MSEVTSATPERRSFSARLKIPLLALLAVLAVSTVFVNKGALQDTPWDAPIYLSRGKEVAQTDYLHSLKLHAKETAAHLPQYKVGEDTSYWPFMRLGNILALGAVISTMGASMASIQTAFWLYSLLLASATVFGVLLSLRIIDTLDPSIAKDVVVKGSIISAALYVASDVYLHLSGDLVAEIPALFLLTGGALALVAAGVTHRISLAILSGFLGFALYVVKIEGVWAYISFSLLYGAVLAIYAREKLWWPAFMIAGISALSLYVVYAWWFWPLPDPRLVPIFAAAFRTGVQNPVAPIKLWIVAGGMLWVGLLLAFRYRVRSPAFWLALGWLALVTLPYLDTIIHHRLSVVRQFALIMPSLLLASSIGWSALLKRSAAGNSSRRTLPLLLAGIAVLLALSHAETYKLLAQLPGGWRLQYVKAFLSPTPYERQSYPVDDLAAISRFVYARRQPTIVVRGNDVAEEHLTIISYFGPPLSRSSIDQFYASDEHMGMCGAKKIQLALEPVMYCSDPPAAETLAKLAAAGVRILYLQQRSGTAARQSPEDKAAFMTKNLVLLTGYRP